MKIFTLIQRPSALFRKNINLSKIFRFCSTTNANKPINQDPSRTLQSLKEHNWLIYDPKHLASAKSHKSMAEQYIHKAPVIMVDDDVVRCIGGARVGTGHPQVYIQLNTRNPEKPQSCRYCGLKFMKKPHHHAHHGEGNAPSSH